MYFPGVSYYFKEDEYRRLIEGHLENMIEDLRGLIEWNKTYVDEYNFNHSDNKIKINNDYIELKNIISKILSK